jgi:hypothetical protein
MIRNLTSQLLEPLLCTANCGDEGNPAPASMDPDNEAAEPEITTDSAYSASWKDLVLTWLPVIHLIIIAGVFFLLAAVAQVSILDSMFTFSTICPS